MSTSLKCHTCQIESPPCYRSFFDLTLNIKMNGQTIDQLVKTACTTVEQVSEVHCGVCWLANLSKLSKDLPESLRQKFLAAIKNLQDLPGCEYDEASREG